jgi:hypothetical protein
MEVPRSPFGKMLGWKFYTIILQFVKLLNEIKRNQAYQAQRYGKSNYKLHCNKLTIRAIKLAQEI